MPRFFIHVRGACGDLSRDELGLDYPDVETAHLEVFRAAREIRRELASQGRDPQGYAVEVVSASGKLVFALPFSEIDDQQLARPLRSPADPVTTAHDRRDRIVWPDADPARQVELVRDRVNRLLVPPVSPVKGRRH
jgi:hypothetical protein